MARNPYQMDPFLAQGFSNLTKALIGDPETDYQVSRTNRVNALLPLEKAQLEAAAAKDNSQAGKFDQETADLLAMSDALNLLASDPIVSQAFIEPLGLPKVTPYGQPITINPEVTGAMVRAILQGGSPKDRASALDTVGGGRARRFAERQILTGNDTEAGRGALLLDPSGGQYQNPGFALQELQGNLDLGFQESEDDLIADKFSTTQQFGKGGQGDRDTKAKIAGERDVAQIQADAEKDWQQAVQELENKSALEIAKIEDDTKRYDIDQSQKRLKDENVYKQYITVNGEMIVSPELGQELGIQPDPNTNKYTMSFGATESMIDVEIENPSGQNTIVKIAPKNIDKINPVLKNGKLVIPENHNFNAATPKENRENLTKFNASFEKDIKNYTALGELPGSALVKVREYAYNNLNLDIADGKTYDQAYAESVLPILQSGNITVDMGFMKGEFLFPEYFYKATRNNPAKLKTTAIEMGYSNEQAEALMNYQN